MDRAIVVEVITVVGKHGRENHLVVHGPKTIFEETAATAELEFEKAKREAVALESGNQPAVKLEESKKRVVALRKLTNALKNVQSHEALVDYLHRLKDENEASKLLGLINISALKKISDKNEEVSNWAKTIKNAKKLTSQQRKAAAKKLELLEAVKGEAKAINARLSKLRNALMSLKFEDFTEGDQFMFKHNIGEAQGAQASLFAGELKHAIAEHIRMTGFEVLAK
ncbi:hypothetical protein HZC09_03470 [Candidatus Micrarchaeota archaeon]|nr:hypothetical protein [Candidatus Micrarchaeota archaeon]